MARLTAAISAGDVAGVGAIENGPETGRTSGRNVPLAAFRLPRSPTVDCAKAEVSPVPGARFVGGSGTMCPMARGFAGAALGAAFFFPDIFLTEFLLRCDPAADAAFGFVAGFAPNFLADWPAGLSAGLVVELAVAAGFSDGAAANIAGQIITLPAGTAAAISRASDRVRIVTAIQSLAADFVPDSDCFCSRNAKTRLPRRHTVDVNIIDLYRGKNWTNSVPAWLFGPFNAANDPISMACVSIYAF